MRNIWMDSPRIAWQDVCELHAVRNLAKIINRRWNLGLGFAAAELGDF